MRVRIFTVNNGSCKGLGRPPPATISSPLYQRILQFEALSSCPQQGNDVRKFAVEFSGAAERLGYNEAALKDLFNSTLDEPLSCWRMRGQDHLTFGEFVKFLARSPAKVAGVPQVVVGEAAVPPVTADEAAAHPGIPGLVRKLEDPRMRSVRAAGIPILAPPKAAVPASELAPFREPTESAPEPAPSRESTESAPEPAPSREPTESAPEPAPFREPTQSAPVLEPSEPAPVREPTEPAQWPPALPVPPWPPAVPAPSWPPVLPALPSLSAYSSRPSSTCPVLETGILAMFVNSVPGGPLSCRA